MLEIFVSNYIEFIAKSLSNILVKSNSKNPLLRFEEEKNSSIDARIKKIDLAKNNLLEGLTAINDLQLEASKNKKDVELAVKQLEELRNNKASLENEVESIKKIIDSDINSFKKIVGVPSSKDIRSERIIGFISGIAASIIASLLVLGGIGLFKLILK